jgi:AcrR family transcriptional regulator
VTPGGETTDARLLAIARDHVRLYGARRTTLVSIAREAGMTHANVYRYFPSKQALVDAVTADWLRGVERLLAEVAEAPDPADDKLERLLLALARAQRDLLETEPNLFALYADMPEEARSIIRRHRARVRTLVERVIEEGIGSGAFAVKSHDRAGALVLDAVFRFVQPAAVALDRETPRRSVENRLAAVVGTVLRGLKAGLV